MILQPIDPVLLGNEPYAVSVQPSAQETLHQFLLAKNETTDWGTYARELACQIQIDLRNAVPLRQSFFQRLIDVSDASGTILTYDERNKAFSFIMNSWALAPALYDATHQAFGGLPKPPVATEPVQCPPQLD